MRQTTPLDAQLFLVRHLLILKEITQNMDLVQREVEPNIDFAGVTGMLNFLKCFYVTYCSHPDTLASMLSKTTSLLPDALFASLGMPRSGESIKEAKHVRPLLINLVDVLKFSLTYVGN